MLVMLTRFHPPQLCTAVAHCLVVTLYPLPQPDQATLLVPAASTALMDRSSSGMVATDHPSDDAHCLSMVRGGTRLTVRSPIFSN
ncbi:hypothetical protein B0I37DRAFT_362291 [Chaetomium sp. MPI-CAGE-AT-0009]|nr:hypothetical protein B0I37DRAFT_362291 [Chaetomium sp. MPI-CAGE-AT-0009]